MVYEGEGSSRARSIVFVAEQWELERDKGAAFQLRCT